MENIIYQWRCSSMAGRQIVTGDRKITDTASWQIGFANRDPGFGNFRDLVTSLISRFPVLPAGILMELASKKSCNYICLA